MKSVQQLWYVLVLYASASCKWERERAYDKILKVC